MTTVTYPASSLVAALGRALPMIGAEYWRAKDGAGSDTLALDARFGQFAAAARGESAITTCVGLSADEVNAQLEDADRSTRLQPWTHPFGIGLAGILKATGTWVRSGSKITIVGADGANHPGFGLLTGDNATASVYRARGGEPIVVLRTVKGYVVRVQVQDQPKDLDDYLERVVGLHLSVDALGTAPFKKVRIPDVLIDQPADFSAARGLVAVDSSGHPWVVEQAVGHTLFGLNFRGFYALEEAAVQVEPRSAGTDHTVNQPFLITAGWPEQDAPLFAAYVDMENWASPPDTI